MLDGAILAFGAAEPGDCRFGRFVLRRRERLLLREGRPVELGNRAFDVLLALAGSGGALVTKAALLERVWSGLVVEENNLQVQISTLRRVLEGDRDWIMTVPGQGYRFLAAVEEVRGGVAAPWCGARAAPLLSVVVLPFAGRQAGEVPECLADGITDSLTTDLARALPNCRVIAQTTANHYKGRGADVREIGEALGVRFVVEGSVMRAEGRLRVNVQLIDATTGGHVWAERFDKPDGDALAMQDEIVARLSRGVGVHMIGCEAARAGGQEAGVADRAALVLRGQATALEPRLTPARYERAASCYHRALELDPCDADALAGLASALLYQVVNGYGRDGRGQVVPELRAARLDEAAAALGRALEIAPQHRAALMARLVLLRARGAFADALAAAQALVAREGSEPAACREVGLNLLYLGRTEQAVDWFRRADTLAPQDPARWTWLQGLGRALMQLGRDAEAAAALREAVESNPAHPALLAYTGGGAGAVGRAGPGADGDGGVSRGRAAHGAGCAGARLFRAARGDVAAVSDAQRERARGAARGFMVISG